MAEQHGQLRACRRAAEYDTPRLHLGAPHATPQPAAGQAGLVVVGARVAGGLLAHLSPTTSSDGGGGKSRGVKRPQPPALSEGAGAAKGKCAGAAKGAAPPVSCVAGSLPSAAAEGSGGAVGTVARVSLLFSRAHVFVCACRLGGLPGELQLPA